MKEEDADWVIYHLIVKEPSISLEGLVTASGLDPCVVDASLKRLERYLLIEQTDGKLRVLNFGEALLRCQIQVLQGSPVHHRKWCD